MPLQRSLTALVLCDGSSQIPFAKDVPGRPLPATASNAQQAATSAGRQPQIRFPSASRNVFADLPPGTKLQTATIVLTTRP